jgi:acyl-CoA synthetase (AMP-forming)/AMP-acid ligase II
MNAPTDLPVFDRLMARAAESPERPLFAWVGDAGRDEGGFTHGELLRAAEAVAAELLGPCGLRPGDRAVLVHPPGLAFLPALFGCLRAGIVPVPVPPAAPATLEHDVARLAAMARVAGAKAILTSREYDAARRMLGVREAVKGLFGRRNVAWPDLPWHVTDRAPAPRDTAALPPYVTPAASDLAYLQFTSGSTGAPKAVRITHGNLVHQLGRNQVELDMGVDAHMVAWVPHFHDFGLISGILSAAYGNGRLTAMSPLAFIRRPALWLEVASRVRATHLAAPTFAYDLVLRKSRPTERASFRLDAVRVAMAAAEPVRPELVRAFCEAFAESGFRADAFCPAYGLAEHAVGVTTFGRGVLSADRATLEREGRVAPPRDEDPRATVVLAACGAPKGDVVVRIVDPETGARRADGHVGEIWLDSPSKADGYEGLPAESARAFGGRLADDDGRRYLRTGDLGLLHEDQLYVTGRLADLISLGDRSLYPQDIEASVVGSHDGIRPGGVAAFSANHDGAGEALVVVAELRSEKPPPDELGAVVAAVQGAVQAGHGVPCRTVVLGATSLVPKTTSGKVRRRASRQAFLDGTAQRHPAHRRTAIVPARRSIDAQARAQRARDDARERRRSQDHDDAFSLDRKVVRWSERLPKPWRTLWHLVRGVVGTSILLFVFLPAIGAVLAGYVARARWAAAKRRAAGRPVRTEGGQGFWSRRHLGHIARLGISELCLGQLLVDEERRGLVWRARQAVSEVATVLLYLPFAQRPIDLFDELRAAYGGEWFPFGDGVTVASHASVAAWLSRRDVLKRGQSLGWPSSDSQVGYSGMAPIFLSSAPDTADSETWATAKQLVIRWLGEAWSAVPPRGASADELFRGRPWLPGLLRLVPRHASGMPDRDVVWRAYGEAQFYLLTHGGQLSRDERRAYLDLVANPAPFFSNFVNFLVGGSALERKGLASFDTMRAALYRDRESPPLKAMLERRGAWASRRTSSFACSRSSSASRAGPRRPSSRTRSSRGSTATRRAWCHSGASTRGVSCWSARGSTSSSPSSASTRTTESPSSSRCRTSSRRASTRPERAVPQGRAPPDCARSRSRPTCPSGSATRRPTTILPCSRIPNASTLPGRTSTIWSAGTARPPAPRTTRRTALRTRPRAGVRTRTLRRDDPTRTVPSRPSRLRATRPRAIPGASCPPSPSSSRPATAPAATGRSTSSSSSSSASCPRSRTSGAASRARPSPRAPPTRC